MSPEGVIGAALVPPRAPEKVWRFCTPPTAACDCRGSKAAILNSARIESSRSTDATTNAAPSASRLRDWHFIAAGERKIKLTKAERLALSQ